MRVIKVDPGQEPVAVQIGNDVADMDAVVRGFPKQFHNVPRDKRRLVFYRNEQGHAYKLPPNREQPGGDAPILGPILVVAFDVAKGTQVDMTDEEVADTIKTLLSWTDAYQPPPPPCTHPVVRPGVLGGGMCEICAQPVPSRLP